MLRRDTEGTGMTYATAIKGNVLFTHTSNLARAKARKHQVLIDKEPSAECNSLKELSEKELIVKANEGVAYLKDLSKGEEVRFIGAKKLANGGGHV